MKRAPRDHSSILVRPSPFLLEVGGFEDEDADRVVVVLMMDEGLGGGEPGKPAADDDDVVGAFFCHRARHHEKAMVSGATEP